MSTSISNQPLLKGSTFLIAFTLFFSFMGNAQGDQKMKKDSNMEKESSMNVDVSDEELKKLLALEQDLRSMQMKTRKKMQKNVQDSELGQKRYMEIRRAKRTGDKPAMTEKEKKQIEKLKKKNEKAQKELKKRVRKKVEQKGMKWERFQKINKAVRQDKETQKRYRKLKVEQQQKGGKIERKKQEPKKKEKVAPSDQTDG